MENQFIVLWDGLQISILTLREFTDTLKAFDDFKMKQKSVWSNVFWYVKVCIFYKCIQQTIHWDKTNVKKISSGQNKQYKKCPFYYTFYTALLLICDS